ncbi:MAG: tetratricopeptide repeat protein [Burkholderiales bacterium]
MPQTTDGLLAAAAAHAAAGRAAPALRAYEEALALDPDHPVALLGLAEHALASGRPADAVAPLLRAAAAADRRGGPVRDIHFALGRAHMALAAPAAALPAFRRMLAAAPGDVVAALAVSSAALASGDAPEAERVLREALRANPDAAGAWANLAVALSAQRNADEAFRCAQRAVDLAPDSAAACQVLAAAAVECGRPAAAIPACRAALARRPEHPALAAALADALKGAGAREEAYALLAPRVREARPAAAVLVSFGALAIEAGRFAEALPALERAVAADARNPRAWDNLGTARRRSGDGEGAADAYARAVALDATATPSWCNLIDALRALCAWDRLDEAERQWQARRARGGVDPRWNPFVAVRDDTSPRQQLEIARAWSRRTLPVPAAAAPAFVRTRGTRLRVGYLSSDLQEHATARLAAGLFERHDRTRFETFAYSHGRDDGSAMRTRLVRAFDHWVDFARVDDDAAAQRIRADAIDVLVDLKGHTQDSRLAILARRPAPVQVHYLGFPGTLGFDAVTHLVADDVVAPVADAAHFSETVVRMPRCYQVNDDRRPSPPASPRDALGLPADATVVACFNQPYKLSRRFLRLWIDAIRDVPDCVLWLFAPQETARANLAREAAALGMPATRVVFAPAVAQEAHVARLAAADLAVDVLPCGAHTTGSDALWAGVPLLTVRGDTFAGRVGTSLVHAVQLPDLATDTVEAYATLLGTLVRDRERLRAYRHHLASRRAELPLFDTAGFTRDFERLLEGLAGAR